MNYYPFHIGDYLSATRHLSWDEDCAYRRLLDVYYTSEKPLPMDIKRVCRLAVASSKVQRDAVAAVLEEFFEKTDAGWTNARADEEIDAMRIKQAAGEEKAAHEAGRMSRYRERRAAMFQALRAVDVVPAWDISMKELQHLHDQRCNATGGDPATHLQREQAVSGDATATAVPTPTPTPTPTPIEEEGRAQRKRSAPTPAVGQPDDVDQQTWGDWLALRKAKRAPVTETVVAGARSESEKAGMSLNDFLQVWCRRGSQGLEADWLKPDERQQARNQPAETTYQRSMRERMQEAAPAIARKAPEQHTNPIDFFNNVIDVQSRTVEKLQ